MENINKIFIEKILNKDVDDETKQEIVSELWEQSDLKETEYGHFTILDKSLYLYLNNIDPELPLVIENINNNILLFEMENCSWDSNNPCNTEAYTTYSVAWLEWIIKINKNEKYKIIISSNWYDLIWIEECSWESEILYDYIPNLEIDIEEVK